jgi:5-oxoprolinase (ATP-hydrolysing)/N-methylhydantoinase A
VTLSILRAETVYVLKCLLNPDVPSNAGDFRPVRITAPEGSVLNCKHPASVNNRTRTLWCVPPLIMRALADVLPDRVQAFTGFPLSIKVYGTDADGRPFNDHLFQAGGQGASAHDDGCGAVLFPTSAGNVSIETFEARTPFLVDEKAYIPDSGGTGTYRGAPGQRVTVRRLPGSLAGSYLVGAWPTGMRNDTPGLRGGLAGARMHLVTDEGPGTATTEHDGGVFFDMRPRQRLTVSLPGGAGYGPPGDRPEVARRRDLEEGYVGGGASAHKEERA